jgi:hypothetical protein
MTPTRTSFGTGVIPLSCTRSSYRPKISRARSTSALSAPIGNITVSGRPSLAPEHRGAVQATARQPNVGFSSRSRGRSKFGKTLSPPRSNMPNTITYDGPTRRKARASKNIDDIASSRQIELANIRGHVGSNNLSDGVQSAMRRPLLQPLENAAESAVRSVQQCKPSSSHGLCTQGWRGGRQHIQRFDRLFNQMAYNIFGRLLNRDETNTLARHDRA